MTQMTISNWLEIFILRTVQDVLRNAKIATAYEFFDAKAVEGFTTKSLPYCVGKKARKKNA